MSKVNIKFNDNNQSRKDLEQVITSKYRELINKSRTLSEEPNSKIDLIEKNIVCITSLLVTWDRYVEILYANNEELDKYSNLMKNQFGIDAQNNPYSGDLTFIDEENDDINVILGFIPKISNNKSEYINKLQDVESK